MGAAAKIEKESAGKEKIKVGARKSIVRGQDAESERRHQAQGREGWRFLDKQGHSAFRHGEIGDEIETGRFHEMEPASSGSGK